MSRFVHVVAFHAGGYFRTDRQARVWRRFFGVIDIFNAKFVLDLGMVRTQRGFRILGCIWDVVIIFMLKYVLK